jgi:hypothetical protein
MRPLIESYVGRCLTHVAFSYGCQSFPKAFGLLKPPSLARGPYRRAYEGASRSMSLWKRRLDSVLA